MFFENKSKEQLLLPYCTPNDGEAWLLSYNGEPIPKAIQSELPYLCSTMRPCNKIVFADGPATPWDSKLGGCPYLEDAAQYPMDEKGKPMVFFAQINFNQLSALPDFPKTGILQFFITSTAMAGLGHDFCLRYIPQPHMDEDRLLSENPFRKLCQLYEPFDDECRLQFQPKDMFCSTTSPAFINRYAQGLSSEKMDALLYTCFSNGSRIGGYPLFVQETPEHYLDGSRDVLLLQLDMDDLGEYLYGDGGIYHFLISKEDLRNCDFSKVHFDWQCDEESDKIGW